MKAKYDMDLLWSDYLKTMNNNFHHKDYSEYINNVKEITKGSIDVAKDMYAQITSEILNPLVKHFIQWVYNNAQYNIIINQRDAWPFFAYSNNSFQEIYMTRGIYLNTNDNVLSEYLDQHLHKQPITLIDTGCMGSASNKMRQLGYTVQSLFLYTKNPGIQSFFTNENVKQIIRKTIPKCNPDKFAHIIMRTFDLAIPKYYQSPNKLKRNHNGILTPVLKKSDKLSQVLAKTMESYFGNQTLEETIYKLAKEFIYSRHGGKSILMQFHTRPNTNKLLWC